MFTEKVSYGGGKSHGNEQVDISQLHPMDGEVIPGEGKALNESKFTFKNACVMLTYKYHINKELLQKHIHICARVAIEKFHAAHETGNKTVPYKHTHAVIVFVKAVQTINCRLFDITMETGEVVHPHWKRFPRKALNTFLSYISKEDPECAHLKGGGPTLWGQVKESHQRGGIDAVLNEHMNKPSDANGLFVLCNNIKREIAPSEMAHACLWQYQFMVMLAERTAKGLGVPPTEEEKIAEINYLMEARRRGQIINMRTKFMNRYDRKIIVIHDRGGCSGKTWLAKQCMRVDPVKFHVMTITNAYHAATAIDTAMKSGWSGHTLFMDVPRSAAEKDVYSAIEQIRNGLMTRQKYVSGTMDWDPVNMVLFTNWMPELTAMTKDRWEIYTIEDDLLLTGPISYENALQIRRQEQQQRIGGGVIVNGDARLNDQYILHVGNMVR